MDGNFSTEHMKHRTWDREVALSAGAAFMANLDTYKAYLRSAQEIVQVFRYSPMRYHSLIFP